MARYTAQQRESYRHALVATGVWLGVGAGLDIYLVATHKERVITDVLRTKPGKIFMTVLGLHVVNWLGPVDPFRAASKVISNRFPVRMLSDISSNQ